MTTGDGATAGTCRTCGRDLVHVPGERTYHPASVVPADEPCPAMLPIPGTDMLSNNVPDDQFEPAPVCPHYGFTDLSRCGICSGVDS